MFYDETEVSLLLVELSGSVCDSPCFLHACSLRPPLQAEAALGCEISAEMSPATLRQSLRRIEKHSPLAGMRCNCVPDSVRMSLYKRAVSMGIRAQHIRVLAQKYQLICVHY